jgi:tRNA 2-thiouridine synthesizing protein A
MAAMNTDHAPSDTEIDARGHRCPVPTLRLRRALELAEPGTTLLLIADDPLARIDVPHFAQQAGHQVISAEADGALLRFRIRKAEVPAPSDAQGS